MQKETSPGSEWICPPAALWKVNMGSINPSRKSYRHDTSSAKAVRLISEQVPSRQPRPRPPPGGIMSQAMFGTSGAGAQRWLRPQTCWTDRLGWPDSEPYHLARLSCHPSHGSDESLVLCRLFVFRQEAPFGSSEGGRVPQAIEEKWNAGKEWSLFRHKAKPNHLNKTEAHVMWSKTKQTVRLP